MVSDVLSSARAKMQASAGALKQELSGIRTGRASPALVERLKVDYAGVPLPLNQLAGISAPGPRLLVIQPWDKNSLRDIEKAILKSELGLNPSNDGNVIRLSIPALTEERRLELSKLVKKKVEEREIILRNLRRDALESLKKLEKEKEMSQDELKRATDQLQKLTDASIAEAEKAGHDKEAELMEV